MPFISIHLYISSSHIHSLLEKKDFLLNAFDSKSVIRIIMGRILNFLLIEANYSQE